MTHLANQIDKFGNYTKVAWNMYERMRRFKYWFTATTKRTSTGLGNQNGYVDDLPQAPPLSLKFNNNKFKQGRNNEKERKKI